MNPSPIYLDCNATTPVDKRVVEAMLPYFTEQFGNPASQTHTYGWQAEAAVEKARRTIAKTINAAPEEIIFTSGATEANNLAIKGVAEAYLAKGRHLITVETEHSAVLDPCAYLAKLGFEVTKLGVGKDGLIDVNQLEAAIRPDTILVSIMVANNEIGVIQPLQEIGEVCKKYEVLLHTDAAQAIAKMPLDVQKMQIDLMSLTGHKIYGPKGIGALYVRNHNPRVKLAAQIHGGGQERNLRSGTLYTPQIVGFAQAIALAVEVQESESQYLLHLRERLWQKLSQLDGIYFNGHRHQRLPGNLNVSVAGVNGAALLLALQPQIALSSGSACSLATGKPSHVLKAIGHSDSIAAASLRFGIGRFNTLEEIEQAGDIVVEAITCLRKTATATST